MNVIRCNYCKTIFTDIPNGGCSACGASSYTEIVIRQAAALSTMTPQRRQRVRHSITGGSCFMEKNTLRDISGWEITLDEFKETMMTAPGITQMSPGYLLESATKQ